MPFSEFGKGLSAIVMGIIGVAIVSVIVSRNSSSSKLVATAGNTLSKVIGAAVIPMTQNSTNASLGTSAFSGSSFVPPYSGSSDIDMGFANETTPFNLLTLGK